MTDVDVRVAVAALDPFLDRPVVFGAIELHLFITPRVLRSDDDAARTTAPLHERAKKITNEP